MLRSFELRRLALVALVGLGGAAIAASTVGCAAEDGGAGSEPAAVAVDVDEARDTTAPAALSSYVSKATGEKQGVFKGGVIERADGDPPPPPPSTP